MSNNNNITGDNLEQEYDVKKGKRISFYRGYERNVSNVNNK
jgi:hypothetical protein